MHRGNHTKFGADPFAYDPLKIWIERYLLSWWIRFILPTASKKILSTKRWAMCRRKIFQSSFNKPTIRKCACWKYADVGNWKDRKITMFQKCQKPTLSVQTPKEIWNNQRDSEIFSGYARRLDEKFHVEGKKIVLIINNCPAYPDVDNLKAIELVFLPPNTASKI